MIDFIRSSKIISIDEKVSEKKPPKGLGTRHTFALLGFLCFTLSYSMRFNLSLAMVSMVDHDKLEVSEGSVLSKKSYDSEVCPISMSREKNKLFFPNRSSDASFLLNNTNIKLKKDEPYGPKFDWDEEDQGIIMGCFFWGYVVTQYPGGRLSHKFGAKWIISGGMLLTGILSLILPIVTVQWGKPGLMVIRVLQGLGEGVTFPAMHCMLAHWSPPEEKSRMSTFVFSGISFGSAITMVFGGYIIHYFGWPMLFYSVGIFSIVWFILWTFIVYSDPNKHPRISFEELHYIQHSKEEYISKELPIPWKGILTSLPVWSIFICQVFHSWGHYLMHTKTPKYINDVHHFPIEHNGWFSSLPQFLNFGVSILMAQISDFLIVNKFTSVVFTRKLCTTIALWGSAAAFLGIIFGGCDTIIALTCLNIVGGALGAGFGGWVVNNIDIAPNHAGTVMGIANTVSNCLGFMAPFVTGIILTSYPTLTGWKITFMIPVLLNFSSNIMFLVFASSKVQPWNKDNIIGFE